MASFSVPLSGLQTSSDELDVIGNNLANLDTDGYKDQTISFGDVFSQVMGTSGDGNPMQIGNGVQVASTTSDLSNGSVDSTGTASNMALQGNGFFVVSQDGVTSYTRNGDFTVNSQWQLTTTDGQLVMGFPAANGTVSTTSALAPISVNSNASLAATATTSFSADVNLDSSSSVGTSFSTPITVYDSLGTAQDLTITYTNTGTNTWSYDISLPASATGASGTTTTVASGTLAFNSSGALQSVTPTGGTASTTGTVAGINITGLADGAANMSLTWNLDSSGTPTITQQDSTSTTTTTTQNGYAAGTLSSYSVLSDGVVQGEYSNGQTLALGQVAIATFANPQGLTQGTDGDLTATSSSGAAVIGQAGVGGDGTITGGAVEESNVNLSTEFANLIVAQEAYDGDAKVLTTLDQVEQSTIQMIQ